MISLFFFFFEKLIADYAGCSYDLVSYDLIDWLLDVGGLGGFFFFGLGIYYFDRDSPSMT